MIGIIFNLPNLLYVVAVAISFLKPDYEMQSPIAYIIVLTLFELAHLRSRIFRKDDGHPDDMYSIIFAIAILWDVEAKFIKSLHYTVFPPPENVFSIFTQDYDKMIQGFFHSIGLIIAGVGLGMFFGVFLGLLIGWNLRARQSLTPIINVIAAIPALVYAPYVVAVAPDFKSASIITIFLGIFFPTLMNMIGNVAAVDKRLIDSAKSLNLSSFDMIFKVLLPDCAIPVITSLRIRISAAFMILTMAETIGSNTGLGYYVRKWSSFADYERVFAGIILIAVVVTAINSLIKIFEGHTMKWTTA
ncbi:MAG: ABC transporter permease subunit [Butyrivibrio sp.]|nr:ABC transporter permease subunit [Butyrivibrio sp.]MBP3273671.1 ABC transporter permease subunit [Butyrivibrio sp.]